ncbi:MAG: sugar kinase, ribokinase [Planctomycetota bacterium]|nr:sugar kinase, ribokinase [Planctomycetota bacterium]
MRRTRVFGPAYLDRVLRVDRPLLNEGTVDGSYDGQLIGERRDIFIEDGDRTTINLSPPTGWPGPLGRIRLSRPLSIERNRGENHRDAIGVAWNDDLGGMGAGFAAALQGELVSAVGSDDDEFTQAILARLEGEGIAHRPITVANRATDWSLIVSSGRFGDKLAIGFRGCHAALSNLDQADLSADCDLLVVAGLPNRLLAQALSVPASVRFVAPAMRNMRDSDLPLASLAGRFDLLSCNRQEWLALSGRDLVLSRTPIVVVTDGPAGCTCYYLGSDASLHTIDLPVFPRDDPPRDTNRAGEAFASTLVSGLMELGWTPGPIDSGMMRHAGLRASAAAALVLDREDFGFPSGDDIDKAIRAGRVAGGDIGTIG